MTARTPPVECRSPFSLFINSYRYLRDLHSFPTRRSSDLSKVTNSDLRNLGDDGLATWSEQNADANDSFDHNTDRKSTRLNSSHGYTSYAVFCLKKKNAAAPGSRRRCQWTRSRRPCRGLRR